VTVDSTHDAQGEPALQRLGAALSRLGRMRLWGRRRPQRPALPGDEAVWSRIERERIGANVHIALAGHLGLPVGLVAAAFAAIAIMDPGSLLPEMIGAGPKVAVAIVMWSLPAMLWLLASRLERLAPPPRLTADETRRQWRKLLWLGVATLAALALLFMLVVVDDPPMLNLAGLVASATLFGAGLRWRTGRELVCRRCQYPVEGEPHNWTRCSECGAELQAPLAVVRGRDVRRPWVAILALAVWGACVWALAGMLTP
jgi:hypothetical protein